jgi:hypothetical protein
MSVPGESGALYSLSRRGVVANRQAAASHYQVEHAGNERLRQLFAVLASKRKGLKSLSRALERSRADGNELLILDGIEVSEVCSELLRLGKPRPDRLRPPEHRERPGSMFGELVTQHGMVDIAEHDEGFVDDVQCSSRLIGGDFENGQNVVCVCMSQGRGNFTGDPDRLKRVMAALVEAAHAAECDREVAVGRHGESAARRNANKRRCVLLGGPPRIGEPHR